MFDWEKFNETLKHFEIKSLGQYHDLYVQSDTLLLADDLRTLKICLKIYKLYPEKFLSVPGLAWQTALKKTKVKLDLLTDVDMLMVEKGVRQGICHSVYQYAKANNKYIKDYDKK